MSSNPSGYGRVRSFITFLLDAASVAVRDRLMRRSESGSNRGLA